MLLNDKIRPFYESARNWKSLSLPAGLRVVGDDDFIEARGCILVRQVMCSNHEALGREFDNVDFELWQDDAKKMFLDRTGYEAAEHLHLEDVGLIDDQIGYSLAFVRVVFRAFRAKYRNLVLRAVISNEVEPEFGPGCTIRFHVRRSGESWLAMDDNGNLTDYPINGVLVIDSDDPLMIAHFDDDSDGQRV